MLSLWLRPVLLTCLGSSCPLTRTSSSPAGVTAVLIKQIRLNSDEELYANLCDASQRDAF